MPKATERMLKHGVGEQRAPGRFERAFIARMRTLYGAALSPGMPTGVPDGSAEHYRAFAWDGQAACSCSEWRLGLGTRFCCPPKPRSRVILARPRTGVRGHPTARAGPRLWVTYTKVNRRSGIWWAGDSVGA